MGARGSIDWGAMVPDAAGLYDRRCSWCGDAFRASRRDAQLCSATCRAGASRDDARLARASVTALSSRCVGCGEAIELKRSSKRYCTDSCRQRMHRLRRADSGAQGSAVRVRACAERSCASTFAVVTRVGRPRRFCSDRCRLANHRASTTKATDVPS